MKRIMLSCLVHFFFLATSCDMLSSKQNESTPMLVCPEIILDGVVLKIGVTNLQVMNQINDDRSYIDVSKDTFPAEYDFYGINKETIEGNPYYLILVFKSEVLTALKIEFSHSISEVEHEDVFYKSLQSFKLSPELMNTAQWNSNCLNKTTEELVISYTVGDWPSPE